MSFDKRTVIYHPAGGMPVTTANPFPVTGIGIGGTVNVTNCLVPVPYDELVLAYTGTQLDSVEYKMAGATVATLTLTYVAGNLTSVVKT